MGGGVGIFLIGIFVFEIFIVGYWGLCCYYIISLKVLVGVLGGFVWFYMELWLEDREVGGLGCEEGVVIVFVFYVGGLVEYLRVCKRGLFIS